VLQLLEEGHRDLVARQPQIAPLRAAIDSLLQGSGLDIATNGAAVQQQCDEMLDKMAVTKLQVQPGDAPAADAGWLFGLQLHLLASTILQPKHAADMCRLFEGLRVNCGHCCWTAPRAAAVPRHA
jgi:hypothetical protein